jgi:rubrerythrin
MESKETAALMKAFALESRLAARAKMMALAARAAKRAGLAAALEAAAASRGMRARRVLRLARGKLAKGASGLLQGFLDDCAESARHYASSEHGPHALEQSGRIDKLMPGLVKRAQKAAGDDAPASYAVCRICGFVKQGDAPERCPICGAVQSKFINPN